ncbi:hypothetical protein [Emticicia sp. TH156]|uniref:hypothetical protein n=1 Tax=Emticicia sp. TH156 TaxID=2067454 RepID=UPI0013042F80|nr:hypothetical protein [Emticicia sp. TH156]
MSGTEMIYESAKAEKSCNGLQGIRYEVLTNGLNYMGSIRIEVAWALMARLKG